MLKAANFYGKCYLYLAITKKDTTFLFHFVQKFIFIPFELAELSYNI